MTNKLNNKKGLIPLDTKNQTGFTIIEVVLVLAIAGLIFLIVFLALPGLQRSRRDTQRKSDFGNMAAALENYASNNGGKYPVNPSSTNCTTGWNGFFGCPVDQVLDNFSPNKGPQGDVYYIVSPTTPYNSFYVTSKASVNNGQATMIIYAQGGYCDGNTATPHGTAPSHGGTDNGLGTPMGYAISMNFESGGQCKSVPAATS